MLEAIRRTNAELASGLETEIVAGLRESDAIIAYPSDQIRDGVRVQARPPQH